LAVLFHKNISKLYFNYQPVFPQIKIENSAYLLFSFSHYSPITKIIEPSIKNVTVTRKSR
jgi:hypothetical protein